MGLYDTFQTDSNLETQGVVLDYGDFRLLVAHTGGANKKYVSYAEKRLKPLRRAIDAGAMDNARAAEIMADIFAKTIILDWETMVDGAWQKGIEAKDGSLLDFTEENVKQTLIALPKLFQDIQEQANSIANFRANTVESDGKNS